MADQYKNDVRLIEAGFPCHQVGAETQRERDTGKAPPVNRLHVWWARRPLTASRAAILASLLPADTDTDWFLQQLGIEKELVQINGVPWILIGKLAEAIRVDELSRQLVVTDKVLKALEVEQQRRIANLEIIEQLCAKDFQLGNDPVIQRWKEESQPFIQPWPKLGDCLLVDKIAADPSHVNQRIEFKKRINAMNVLKQEFKWDEEDLYGYDRVFVSNCFHQLGKYTILDPTSGGGAIPFEALRLGHKVVANDLNPVALVILQATLRYPAMFGEELTKEIYKYGNLLLESLESLEVFFQRTQPLPQEEYELLKRHLKNNTELIQKYSKDDIVDYLFARQVTCPTCGSKAPLLNSCWLAKDGEKWGISIIPDGKGDVAFQPYRLQGSKGPNGEDPNFATVSDGVGTCIHCRQAISREEIKAQARGDSAYGKWIDRLYCVVASRHQPKLDKNGQPQRYKSGEKAGEIKTEKVRFFRIPNETDLAALVSAKERLLEKWPAWEEQGLIPTENIPEGHKTAEPLRVGMERWCDMFTPRQLLGHITLIEELLRLKPQILAELGEERGRAVVTYLQFAIDKGLDYNSRQTRWEYTRGIVKGTFGRHDFSLKWTFGEMVFTGPNSGAAWGLSQVLDAYKGIAELAKPIHNKLEGQAPPVRILHGTAAHMDVMENSVDLICIDPPYYNNVQYAELSDYFYVWQRRTLQDLYPEVFQRRLTNKVDEAVANPVRDGSAKNSAKEYERLMAEIFRECARVLKHDGIMTIMFTHKAQEAWEALTRSLIENNWIITSSMPVESESAASTHQKDMASAASSIFLTCRKRIGTSTSHASWTGFGGTGVAPRIREAVREGLKEFIPLHLNPVDEMVASYGRALKVLSENWPVLDGDELVSPIRAMNEASAVVAQYQTTRLTGGRLKVEDLNPEAAMALTLFGIFGLSELPFDDALNLSKSLNIALEGRAGGYIVGERMIGINDLRPSSRAARVASEDSAFHAPLLRKGSKLRLALPEERNEKRLDHPQTEWDILHGVIMAYREGDIPVARAYVSTHAEGREQVILDLLAVWAAELTDDILRKEAEAILYGMK